MRTCMQTLSLPSSLYVMIFPPVLEAAGLGIPPNALAKYDPAQKEGAQGDLAPTAEEYKEAMRTVQNVIGMRLHAHANKI